MTIITATRRLLLLLLLSDDDDDESCYHTAQMNITRQVKASSHW